jgi:DNA modification methylase
MIPLPWPPADPAPILLGDCRTRLAELPAGVFQTCVTSPPYWRLRDYRVDGQIGLEASIDAWVAVLVEVFGAVRRVLRPDGTLWLNLGDAYSQDGKWGGTSSRRNVHSTAGGYDRVRKGKLTGLGPKQLLLLPARVALALQADGWVLRNEIRWHKPNTLPESAGDRFTRSHEAIFFFSVRARRYFSDMHAIREPSNPEGSHPRGNGPKTDESRRDGNRFLLPTDPAGRICRDVWSFAVQGRPEAHYATFPDELPRRCILAGTSARGQCPACGAPWRRQVVKRFVPQPDVSLQRGVKGASGQKPLDASSGWDGVPRGSTVRVTVGWTPACKCDAGAPVPQWVLDPFAGSGTTLAVARSLGRAALGCELNPEYLALAQARIAAATPWYDDQPPVSDDWADLPLFQEVPT